jgi:peptidyl-prolyl cis-trans isomerase SurA
MISISAIILFFGLIGCNPKESETLVARIGDEKMTVKYYEELYLKNNGGKESVKNATMENKKRFLDLIVNYRLKVQEAVQRGYAEDPEIRKELADYRQSLAVPYLLEREVSDPNIRQLYERRKVDVRVSHILIRPDSPKPEDTLRAWNVGMDVIRRLKAGERFDSLALHYSAVPSVQKDGGDLYFFTGGMTIPVFEDACYGLNIGEVYPTPVKTQYGYHIIKLTDKRPRVSVKASHILIRFNPDSTADTLRAWNEIQDILKTARTGGNFEALAKQLSQDPGSAPNGGDLGYFERRRMVPEFETVAFALKVGEISNVVRTAFGYHIIKVADIKQPAAFDDVKDELKQTYQQLRYMDDYQAYTAKLRKETNYKVYQDTLTLFLSRVDTTKTTSDSAWDANITNNDRAKVLFAFDAQNIILDSVVSKIKSSIEFRGTALNFAGVSQAIQRISEMKLVEYSAKNVEKKYPEFGKIMKDYEEGVLLYKIEQTEVWNKVSVTDSALHLYFDATRDTFRFPDRVDISEIYVNSDSASKSIGQRLKSGENFDTLAAHNTQRADYKEKRGRWGLLAESENDLAAKGFKMNVGMISEPFPYEGGYSIVKVNSKEKARLKTFEEAGPELSNRFQEYESKRIEKAWVDSLKKKYRVEVNEPLLQKAFASDKQESN